MNYIVQHTNCLSILSYWRVIFSRNTGTKPSIRLSKQDESNSVYKAIDSLIQTIKQGGVDCGRCGGKMEIMCRK